MYVYSNLLIYLVLQHTHYLTYKINANLQLRPEIPCYKSVKSPHLGNHSFKLPANSQLGTMMARNTSHKYTNLMNGIYNPIEINN